jgi:hypothetical protein
MRTLYSITMILMLSQFLYAEEADSIKIPSDGISYATSLTSGYTYSGYFIDWTAMIVAGHHALYGGPVILLSDYYLPGDVTTGLAAGWRYSLLNSLLDDRWNFYVSLEYQLIPYIVKYRLEKSKRTNQVHTINMSYGVQFKLYKRIFASNSIGAGVYIDRYYNSLTRRKDILTGLNMLIKLSISYEFDD